MDIDSDLHLRYLYLAIKHAGDSTHYKAKVGCVIGSIKRLHIYSFGINQEKSHPIQKELNISFRKFKDDSCHHYLHAEVHALLRWLQKDTKVYDKSVYVARLDKKGNIKMARPCPACMEAIYRVGIKDIYYTTDKGYCHEVVIK